MTPSGLRVSAMGMKPINIPKPINCPKKDIPFLGGCLNLQINTQTKECENYSLNCLFSTPEYAARASSLCA